MTTIYNGFTFNDEDSGNTIICRRDNGSGLTYCEEFGVNDDGEEFSLGELCLTHQEIAHEIRDKVEWCIVSPDQWDAILAKVSEDVLDDILGRDRDYNESNVGYLLQNGDNVFDGFSAWLLSELDIFNIYDR